ncbi:O-methyltransferase-domain-containing protein [Podospora didyma]|uniref:O-methyltransferase-domain-containing protein n=1 Tax=Podospora didyma TaxID=330526 RepID=A0AAE0TZD7_9PEZI|nr:O-methyltransferase-domain-containing protein [Podospora didyma]
MRQFVDVACLDIFMEWKAFDKIPLDGSISYAELASAIDAQESLVARIAGLLISVGKLQADPNSPLDRVQHSRISPLYRSKSMFGPLATVAVGNGMKPVSRWAEYFARYGRHEPRGQTHTPFSFAWGHPELPPWEVKALYPEYAIRFTKSMKSRQIVGGNMPVAGPSALYDMSWIGGEADKRKGPLVVDVGGGLGQLLRDVVTAVPGVSPERCVLQDRKEVIDEAMAGGDEVIQQVTVMDHDFHTEQPVKGALVYLLRRILLDYSDELATGILRQLANALPADDEKARVIIMEERLLSTPVPANRIVDIFMLNLGGKLRNEKTFGEIARTAGLKVVKFYAREGEPTCVVECAKA